MSWMAAQLAGPAEARGWQWGWRLWAGGSSRKEQEEQSRRPPSGRLASLGPGRLSPLGQTTRGLTIKPGGPRGPWMPFKPMSPGGPCGRQRKGYLVSGRPLGQGSSSSMTPEGWPHFALPFKRGSRESNKCPQLPSRNQHAESVLHGVSLHSDFRVITLYGYHTHFTADKTEAWRYKVTCLMHRAGQLSQAYNLGLLEGEFWGPRMSLLDSGGFPAHTVSTQEIFVERAHGETNQGVGGWDPNRSRPEWEFVPWVRRGQPFLGSPSHQSHPAGRAERRGVSRASTTMSRRSRGPPGPVSSHGHHRLHPQATGRV